MLIDTGLGSVTLVNVRRPWGMYAYSPADELCKPAAVSSIDRAKTVVDDATLPRRPGAGDKVVALLGPARVYTRGGWGLDGRLSVAHMEDITDPSELVWLWSDRGGHAVDIRASKPPLLVVVVVVEPHPHARRHRALHGAIGPLEDENDCHGAGWSMQAPVGLRPNQPTTLNGSPTGAPSV